MAQTKQKYIYVGNVQLPLEDFTISRTAILGITKSGKTYGAKGIVEQLLDHNVPVIIFDCIGVWRWLKVPSQDRKDAKGYPIVVAGGAAPDLPLSVQSAPDIVRAAIRENISLVIDLYDRNLSKADWRRIVADCFRVLLYENDNPRTIVLEEAAEYVPQSGKDMDGKVFAEVEKVGRMGGNAQLGLMMINQRAQELNKSVLELCDNLLLFRQRGSNAIGSLERWLDRVSPAMAKEIGKSLPHMGAGDCWVWAEAAEEPVRTRTHLIKTHHPDRRMMHQTTIKTKPMDTSAFVSRLSVELKTLLETAKNNDPTALRARIKTLEAELVKAQKQKPPAPVSTPSISIKDIIKIRDLLQHAMDIVHTCKRTLETHPRATKSPVPLSIPVATPRQQKTAVPARNKNSADYLSKLGIQILTVLAQFQDRGVSRKLLALHIGRHPNDKTFSNTLGTLRSNGAVDDLSITDKGLADLGPYEGLPEGSELLEWYCEKKLHPAQAVLLRTIAQADDWTKQTLAQIMGRHPNDKTFNNNLGRLRSFGLVDGLKIVPELRD